MTKFFRLLAVIMIVVLCAVIVVGCGSGDSKKSSTSTVQSTATEVASTEAPKEPISLTISMPQVWKGADMDALVEYYQTKTGNKLELQVFPDNQYDDLLKTKVAVQDIPDIMCSYPAAVKSGKLPGDQLVNFAGAPWVSRIINPQSLYSDVSIITSAPYGPIGTFGLIYNKDVFAKAGITEIPMTYTDLLNACEKIKAIGVTPIYIANKEGWTQGIFTMMAFGGVFGDNPTLAADLIANKVKIFESQPLVDSLDRILDIIRKGYCNKNMTSATYAMSADAVAKGEAAMSAQGDWFYAELIKVNPEMKDKVGVIPFTTSDTVSHVTISVSSRAFLVGTASKKQQDAIDTVNLFMTDEYLKVMYAKAPGMAPLKDLDVECNPVSSQIYELGKTIPMLNEMWVTVPDLAVGDMGLQAAFAGEKDMTGKTMLETWYKQMVPILKAKKLAGW